MFSRRAFIAGVFAVPLLRYPLGVAVPGTAELQALVDAIPHNGSRDFSSDGWYDLSYPVRSPVGKTVTVNGCKTRQMTTGIGEPMPAGKPSWFKNAWWPSGRAHWFVNGNDAAGTRANLLGCEMLGAWPNATYNSQIEYQHAFQAGNLAFVLAEDCYMHDLGGDGAAGGEGGGYTSRRNTVRNAGRQGHSLKSNTRNGSTPQPVTIDTLIVDGTGRSCIDLEPYGDTGHIDGVDIDGVTASRIDSLTLAAGNSGLRRNVTARNMQVTDGRLWMKIELDTFTIEDCGGTSVFSAASVAVKAGARNGTIRRIRIPCDAPRLVSGVLNYRRALTVAAGATTIKVSALDTRDAGSTNLADPHNGEVIYGRVE